MENQEHHHTSKGWRAIKYYREHKAPRVIHWIVKHSGGLIKTEDQAEYILLDIGIIIFIISLDFWFK